MLSRSSLKSWFRNKKTESVNKQNYNKEYPDLPSPCTQNDSSSISNTAFPKIITDEPSLTDDFLKFEKYTQKLVNIIINSNPRFSIGIFGSWGTGKTTFMKMIEKELAPRDDILVVWFDAWKYDKEKYLAIIPFIRTIEIELEIKLIQLKEKTDRKNNNIDSRILGKWKEVKNGLEKTFDAFIESTQLNLGIGTYGSAGINLAKFRSILRAEGKPIELDNETIYNHHKHITEYLRESICKLRNKETGGNPSNRIVVFIDDLDRCAPDKALELLESIKTFFDMDGFVYVIGMDSESINSIVKKKYGEDFDKGLQYMEKIVQLPFHIPTWKRGWNEEAISDSIIKILSKELEGSDIIRDFESNIPLIAKAVHSNPRQLKRFINNVILAKTVFDDRDIDKLIVVQALDFRNEWNRFLELITPNNNRKAFFEHYRKMKEEKKIIQKKDLDKLDKELSTNNNIWFREILEIYEELINQQDKNDLRLFLDAGADEILFNIQTMEEYRVALDTTKRPDMQMSNDFFTEFVTSGLASGLTYGEIYNKLGKWANIFNEDRILNRGELVSFKYDLFPTLHTMLLGLKEEKYQGKGYLRGNFYAANDLSTNMMKLFKELNDAQSYDGIQLSEEKKKLILSKQKKISEILNKIEQQMPV